MKDQSILSVNVQEALLESLKRNIPSKYSVVEVMMDLLEISQDAAYRRLRGEKKLDIDEMYKICNTYNISADTIFSAKSPGTQFRYTSLDIRNQDQYLVYMQNISKSIELVKNSADNEIVISAIDIPVFHFMPFHNLTLFKLYAWNNTTYKQSGCFEDFASEITNPEIFNCYNKLASDYSQTPSTEIWTNNTIDTIIRLLDFYFETGLFREPSSPILLCMQLLQMIENLKTWVEQGYKHDPAIPFNFYISDTDLENNFILLKKNNETQCMIKLFTINSLITSDHQFCQETLNWLETSKRRSALLTGASDRERVRYFNNLQQKVNSAIKKFEKSTN